MDDFRTQKEELVDGLLSGPSEYALAKAYHNDPTFRFQVDMLVEMMIISVKALCAEVPSRQEHQRQQERLMSFYTFDEAKLNVLKEK